MVVGDGIAEVFQAVGAQHIRPAAGVTWLITHLGIESHTSVTAVITDGVNEARNNEQEEFEEQRLCDIVYENRNENATAIKNAILEKIEAFVGNQKQHDDLTMVVIKAK